LISRIWHGWTTPEKADAYDSLLREEIFQGIAAQQLPGFIGIDLIRRELGDTVEFVSERRSA
jgi:antibiotic biosynthesis monooxygenase (ABM) superfamily enzyme